MRSPPRSWVVRQPGTPSEALFLQTVEPTAPGRGEAQVEVEAAGLNFPDLLVCAGRYQERPEPPFSPGFEATGTVVEAGRDSRYAIGERVVVVPELPNGALQTCLTVPDAQLYPVPDAMPPAIAAVLHIAYQTAYLALHHRGRLRAADTVLVTGAAGGVGSAVIQLAKAAGSTVLAVASGAIKATACRRLGADVVVDLAEDPDPVDRVRAATAERGADVVIDLVSGGLLDRLRRCVAFEGRVVLVGFTSGDIATVQTNHVLLRNYEVVGLHLARYRRENPALLRDVHRRLVTMWGRGAIAPEIYRELPFDQAPAGLTLLARREVIGRVVLRT